MGLGLWGSLAQGAALGLALRVRSGHRFERLSDKLQTAEVFGPQITLISLEGFYTSVKVSDVLKLRPMFQIP